MPLSLRARALRHLALREHSRAELLRKLAAHGTAAEVHDLLATLQQQGLLSDTRFAESFVRGKAPRLGSSRLRQELAQKGVDRDIIDQALASAGCGDDELERAREIWARKYGLLPADQRQWARQARFLQGRGFPIDIICRILKDSNHEPA